ncbi:ABC transporter permease [Ornithinimicrobium sp. INDO-MA30-4]|uniref:ABC transporter permease n=1 Tax=Ornithinimicrobium sp. INDO-MA30-4 TaxID=2908651 RepID=UPI001F3F4EF1|nr:ABC transporter permease [Ornithinimicrobium sp. INDO-MA30-4]UJH69819.1 ABC transporter permease [Ornithinimicrobium sp. INDO-MA30-4]
MLSTNAAEAGTTLDALSAGSEVVTEDVSGADSDEQLVVFIAGLAFAVLFYIASLMFGMSIATSVIEEKQSRIVEIITAAIPTSQLLAGKVLGNTVLAFAQMVLLVGVSLIGLTFSDYDTYLPMVTEPLLWYLPFFIVGFIALACIWAAAGAMGSRTEDLQTTTMPLTLTLVGLFLLALNLDGAAAAIASYFPVMSTFMMPLRILEGDVTWWQPLLALAITLGFSWLTIRLGARIYRRGLLQTQGKLGFKEALSGS